jgi:hypothetical protein
LAGLRYAELQNAILVLDTTGGTGNLQATWCSKADSDPAFIAWLSRDLSDWGEDLDDSLTEEDDERPEDAEHITVTFPLEGDRADAAELFFWIEAG